MTDLKPIHGRVNVVAKTTYYNAMTYMTTHVFAAGAIVAAVVFFCSSPILSGELRISRLKTGNTSSLLASVPFHVSTDFSNNSAGIIRIIFKLFDHLPLFFFYILSSITHFLLLFASFILCILAYLRVFLLFIQGAANGFYKRDVLTKVANLLRQMYQYITLGNS
jgi:hypothetical protein